MPALEAYLKYMSEKNASDLYFTTGAPPSMRVEGTIYPITKKRLEPGSVRTLAYEIMTEDQQLAFETELELNLGLTVEGLGRFRVNVYMQRGEVAIIAGEVAHLDHAAASLKARRGMHRLRFGRPRGKRLRRACRFPSLRR